MGVKIWIVAFWVTEPCSLVCGYQRFRGTYHLNLLGIIEFCVMLHPHTGLLYEN
jgi:hypothetical protein